MSMDDRTEGGVPGAVAASPEPGRPWAKVWDAPVRVVHWSLALLVATSYATAKLGLIDWHFYAGYAILALVLFRIGWGLIGSDSARFASFVRGPGAALAHLRHVLRGEATDAAGHNPAGGLMVVALLALLLFQALSGLFANDGLFVEGPLAPFAGGAWSDRITSWHAFAFNLILAAVAVHVAAVIVYGVVLRQDLVRPMITGRKRLPAGAPVPRLASVRRALALALLVACGVWLVASLG